MNGDHAPLQQQQEEARRRHEMFVESLERHASGSRDSVSRACWSRIAEELGWTVEQVQAYAFRYMMALNNVDDRQGTTQHQDNGDDDIIMNEGNDTTMNNADNVTNGNSDNVWTLEEDMLLDSLLAVYLPSSSANADDGSSADNGGNRNEQHLDWEEQVASRLPGRTPVQVRKRYSELYGNRGNR